MRTAPLTPHPTLRWVAALLCLIASLAFATRNANPMRMTTGMSLDRAVHAEHHTSGHAHPAQTTQHPKQQDQHSAGHCPFCFTSAFAVESAVVVLLGLLTVRASRAPPTRVHAFLLPIRHADARAPPSFIA